MLPTSSVLRRNLITVLSREIRSAFSPMSRSDFRLAVSTPILTPISAANLLFSSRGICGSSMSTFASDTNTKYFIRPLFNSPICRKFGLEASPRCETEPNPRHITTFWVRVPDWMAQHPHLVELKPRRQSRSNLPNSSRIGFAASLNFGQPSVLIKRPVGTRTRGPRVRFGDLDHLGACSDRAEHAAASASSLCRTIFSSNDISASTSAFTLASTYSLTVWPLLNARNSSSLAYGSSSSIANFICKRSESSADGVFLNRARAEPRKSCLLLRNLFPARPAGGFLLWRNRFNRRAAVAPYSQLF